MKNHLLLFVLTVLGLSSCTKQDSLSEDLNTKWTLTGYANILGQVHCQYDDGDIVWSFEDDKLKVEGQLVTSWAFVPCYEVDNTFRGDLVYSIFETDGGDEIYVEDFGLRAKIDIEEELVIEIISTTSFRPSTESVKLFFKKI